MAEIYRKPFEAVMMDKNEYDAKCLREGNENRVSPDWPDMDGGHIEQGVLGSEAIITPDSERAYFYLPTEKDGFTVYEARLINYHMMPASHPKQFYRKQDAEQVCIMLAKGRVTVDEVKDAGRKGKGSNAAEITLYKRNRSRSDSLVAYRKKIRDRQIPLRKEKQWEVFTRMADLGELTKAAMQQVVYYLEAAEADRERREPQGLPDNWDAKTGGILYEKFAVEGTTDEYQ